jgi:hypothetical protein
MLIVRTSGILKKYAVAQSKIGTYNSRIFLSKGDSSDFGLVSIFYIYLIKSFILCSNAIKEVAHIVSRKYH